MFVDGSSLAFRGADRAVSLPAVQACFVERSHHLHGQLAAVLETTRRAMEASGIDATIHGRIKSPNSTWRKMQRCGLSFEQVYDLVGARVLVGSADDCYRALDALLQALRERLVVVKDYVQSPKPNGYQSIHIRAVGPAEALFEIQVRTWQMHEQSEQGEAAHWRYKQGQAALALGA